MNTLAMNRAACVPPLELDEIYQIIQNVMEYPEPVKTPDFIFPATSGVVMDDEDEIFVDLHTFMENPPDPPSPLVGGGILDAGDGFILGGPSGVGKSWLAFDLALSVANGIPWLGHFPTAQGGVLYVDEEGSGYHDWERMESLIRTREELGDYQKSTDELRLSVMHGLQLDTERGLTIIRRDVERYRPKLVIFDTLVRMHGGVENSNEDMARFFNVANKLKSVYDMAMVFINHVRKPTKEEMGDLGDMLRGASDIRAWPDGVVVATTHDDTAIKLSHVKSRNHNKNQPFIVGHEIDTDNFYARFTVRGQAAEKPQGTEEVRGAVLKVIQMEQKTSQVTVDLIAGRLGLSTKAVKEHIGPLEAMGEIERFVIGRVTGYVIPKDKQEGTLL
jgi:hypothetical protein